MESDTQQATSPLPKIAELASHQPNLFKVSIVIPTHNRAGLLARTVQSALDAASDLEVIVIDDASTDRTPELCATLSGIRYVRLNTNVGLAQARNVGIQQSSAGFVAFLDDDDLRLPGSLDAQVRALESEPEAAFCYGRVLLGDAKRQLPTGQIYPGQVPTGDIFWKLIESNFVPMPSVVVRKSVLIRRGSFNRDLSLVEDWDMCLRLCEQHPVTAVEEPVAIYRRANGQPGQMTSNSFAIFCEALRVQEMALSLPRACTASKAQRRSIRGKLRDQAYVAMIAEASQAMSEGDSRTARTKIREAFGFRPFRAIASGLLLRG